MLRGIGTDAHIFTGKSQIDGPLQGSLQRLVQEVLLEIGRYMYRSLFETIAMVYTARQVSILLGPRQEKKANKGKKRKAVADVEESAGKKTKKQDKAHALAPMAKINTFQGLRAIMQ